LFLKYGFKKENLSNGYYNILYIIKSISHESHLPLIEFLIGAGADPNRGYDKCYPKLSSPMQYARKRNWYTLIEVFKKYKK